MKKNFYLSIIALFCFSFLNAQTWQQKANFPGPARITGETFSINGKGYMVFGRNEATGAYYNDIWEYDPSLDTWSAKNSAPFAARCAGIVFDNDSCVLLGLGWNGSTTFHDLYRYTPATQAWDTLTPYPGNGGRNTLFGSYKNKAYVGGGSQGTNTPYYSDFWEYDITSNTWVARGNLPFGRRVGGVCFNIDSIIYMGLGHNGSTDFNDLWGYNTTTNTWSQKASLPGYGRVIATSSVINGKVIIGAGHRFGSNGQGTLGDYYEYDPTTNSWSTISNNFTNSTRTFPSAFTINDTVYLYGGAFNYPTPLNDFWAFGTHSTVSIAETAIKIADELVTYPNPTKGIFSIKSLGVETNGQLTIFNQEGQVIFERNCRFNKSEPLQIDLSGYENAYYFYRYINHEGKLSSGSIIKVE